MLRSIRFRSIAFLVLLSFVSAPHVSADEPKTAAADFEELGAVPWLMDEAAAVAEAGKSGKPLMVLYTELPGCSGCKVFGRQQLSVKVRSMRA